MPTLVLPESDGALSCQSRERDGNSRALSLNALLTNTAPPAILGAEKNFQKLEDLRRGGARYAGRYKQRHANLHVTTHTPTPRPRWLGPPAHARVTRSSH